MKINKKNLYIANSHDQKIQNEISKLFIKHKLTREEVLDNFPIYARRQNLKRFIAHLEIFKKTIDIPGDIIEFGVYRGTSLMTWANLLETYCIGSRTKKVFGFDNWKGFEKFSKEDGDKIKKVSKQMKNYSPQKFKNELSDFIKLFDKDRFVGWKKRVELISGDASKTIKKFLKDRPGLRFSLIHFDVDLYKPTFDALTMIWDKVSIGGIILFDEYAIENWPGESQAVDDFLKDKKVKIKCLNWNNTPGGYIIKNN